MSTTQFPSDRSQARRNSAQRARRPLAAAQQFERQLFAARHSLRRVAPRLPGNSPNAFELLIDFDNVFDFDRQRNLLLDFTILNASSIGTQLPIARYLDAAGFATPAAPFARVWGTGSTVAGFGYGYGLVTQFDLVSVPEPSGFALLAFALGATRLTLHRSRKAQG
jgi:hypothetical protein